MYNSIKIPSVEQDRAELMAFVHAIALPVIIGLVAYVASQELAMLLIASGLYVLLLMSLNIIRAKYPTCELDLYKSDKYFEYLKFIVSVVAILSFFALLVIVGVHYA